MAEPAMVGRRSEFVEPDTFDSGKGRRAGQPEAENRLDAVGLSIDGNRHLWLFAAAYLPVPARVFLATNCSISRAAASCAPKYI